VLQDFPAERDATPVLAGQVSAALVSSLRLLSVAERYLGHHNAHSV